MEFVWRYVTGYRVLSCFAKAHSTTATVDSKLKKLCDTRWVERHDAVKVFYCLYQFFIDALTEITMWCDAASAIATTHLASIPRGDVVIAMAIMHNVLLKTKQLSVSLQQVNIDLTRCLYEIQVVF